MRWEFEGEMWLYEGRDPWHFVTLPLEMSEAIRDDTAGSHRGFGSVRVLAAIGKTTWSTSVFPDKASGAFQLPVKAAVREAEDLMPGDIVAVRIDVAERSQHVDPGS